jgi:hypothetical protein
MKPTMQACAAVLCAITLIQAPVRANRPQEATEPMLTVPRLTSLPTIDGRIEPGEWDRAAVVSGFINATGRHGGRIAHHESRIYLAHNGRRLYLAVYCQLPPGVRPSMNHRRRNSPVYMDNYQIELWLTPPMRDRVTAYQFIGNAYGAIFDNRQVPDLGISNVAWNGNWEFKNHYVTGEYWTAELAIDFAELGVPTVDPGQLWRGMVGVAWPQRSWPYTFGWYKNIESHARLIFADDGLAAQLHDFSSLLSNKLEPKLKLVNSSASPAEFTVEAKVGDTAYRRSVTVAADSVVDHAIDAPLPDWPEGAKQQTATLAVRTADGRPLLVGDWYFSPLPTEERTLRKDEPKPWAMNSRVQFAPLAMGVRTWVDVLDYERRDELTQVRFTVQPQGGGQPVLTKDVEDFAYDAAEAFLWLPAELPHGTYDVHMQFRDASGGVLAESSKPFDHRDLKKEFVWLGTDPGGDIQVRPPFEPVKADGNTLSVWGRSHVMRGALPDQVTSQGAAMLASPITLIAMIDGVRQEAALTEPFKMLSTDDREASFEGVYKLAGLTLRLRGTMAFDGMLRYRLDAEPQQGEAGESVERLFIAMPVKAEHARYYFSTGGGWNVAVGETAAVGEGRQVIWDSRETGDFVPYVGLTDDDRAIQWFADHAHEWVLGDDAPAAQIERDGEVVEVQVNLVRRAGPVPAFAAEFGFIASPVRPVLPHWRHTSLHSHPIAGSKVNFFYGPGHGGTPIDLHDTAKLAKAMKLDLPEDANPDVALRDLPPTRTQWDEAHLRQLLGNTKFDSFRSVRASATNPDPNRTRICYFYNAKMYFEGTRSAAFRTFFPAEWQLDPHGGWFHLTPVESYQDFFSFHLDLWFKHFYVPGLYFDEVYIAPDYNVFNGNGLAMPDGSVRPTVPLMHQRRYLQRMRQLFFDHDQDPFIWVHTSNYMAPHAISAVEIAMFGEDRTPTPTTDIIDTIPSIHFRSIGRAQKFGFVPVWMVMAGRGGSQWGLAGRQSFLWCWMHDVVPEYHTTMTARHLIALRAAWGIDADDVGFIPFWSDKPAARSDDPQFIVSAWTRPGGKAMLMVLNLHPTESAVTQANLTLDPKALGLSDRYRVLDLESGPAGRQWLQMTAEAGELIRLNTPFDQIRPIVAPADKLLGSMSDQPGDMTVVSEGPAIRIDVPARDARVLIIEPR